MSHVIETVVASALIGFFVWIWTIYNRVQGHTAMLRETRDDVKEVQGEIKQISARLRVQEDNSISINLKLGQIDKMDKKIDELLNEQRRCQQIRGIEPNRG